MNFQLELKTKINEIEETLNLYLPTITGNQGLILEAMEYSLLAGGKRIRPLLMKEIYSLFNGAGEEINCFMAAIEMIHTYSLVHDDLPAMDDDDYRRGRKTTHIVYGEDMGILAGDALLNYAFEVATKSFDMAPDNSIRIGKSLQVLSKKSGVYGMIGGQVIDVKHTGESLSKEMLDEIFRLKTGALIEASMMIGAILAGASQEEIQKVEKIAASIGMAFQIQDDILDVTGDADIIGKPILSDEKNQKTTYISLMGIDQSKEQVLEYSSNALDLLDSINGDSEFLKAVINMLIYRDK